jgi:hypothetical protein
MLDVAPAAALSEDARVIRPIHNDTAITIQPVVNIHPALRIVNVSTRAVGTRTNHTTVRRVHLVTASRRRVTREGS